MRCLSRSFLIAWWVSVIVGLTGCATQKFFWNHVYRNDGTLDITGMTVSYSNGMVAKDMVSRAGSETLAGLFVEPPRWVDVAWMTSDGVRHQQKIALEDRLSDVRNMSGIVIKILDDRVEVFETDRGGQIWRGTRRIF